MKTKPIPIIITLAAALISCVISIVERVEFSVFVYRLFFVVLIFLAMGTIIKMVLDYSFRTLEPPASIDGDVLSEAASAPTEGEEDAAEEESVDDSSESEEG